jgi:flagellar hook-associated protein FlgK
MKNFSRYHELLSQIKEHNRILQTTKNNRKYQQALEERDRLIAEINKMHEK